MNTTRRFGAFSSSDNPQQLADTVKGLLIGASGLIIYLASLMGIELINEQISAFAAVLATSISAVWTLFGLIKKIVVAITKRNEV